MFKKRRSICSSKFSENNTLKIVIMLVIKKFKKLSQVASGAV